MTNIKDIIVEKKMAFPILKTTGELSAKHNLIVLIIVGFLRDPFLNRNHYII